jgi:hypothetical protein
MAYLSLKELKDQGTCEWITYFYNLEGVQDYHHNDSSLILISFLE